MSGKFVPGILGVVLAFFLCGQLEARMTTDKFISICAIGSVEEMRQAIEGGADVNGRSSPNGFTPLIMAAMDDQAALEKVKILLAHKADPMVKTASGQNMLFYVADNADLELTRLLLDLGLDVNAVDELGFSPLSEACTRARKIPVDRRKPLIKMLLDGGATYQKQNRREHAAFTGAAVWADPELLQWLIEAGFEVNGAGETGHTALVSAARGNPDPETIRYLLKAGADANSRDKMGETALIKAERNTTPGAGEIRRILTEAAPDSAIIPDGFFSKPPTADLLNEICMTGAAGTLRKAIAAGANVNAKGILGYPLFTAVEDSLLNLDKVKILLDHGADLKKVLPRGKTLLHHAAINGRVDLAAFLLDQGLDVNAVDADGDTPLAGAGFSSSRSDNEQLFRLFLAHGAKPSKQVANSQKPLITVSYWAEPELIELLLKAGFEINKPNINSITALMAAASANAHSETVRYLLKAGADPSLRNKAGKTALDLTEENESPAAAQIKRILEEASKN